MIRSLYSGIGGMTNFQTKLDVIGNNIANVNTHGFKKGRTTFNDLVSQQMAGASAPVAGGRGGTNPIQVGLGSGLASIDTIDTQGSIQTTGRELDLAISGDGYFVVDDGQGNIGYTRAGNFYRDSAGTIVNANGFIVTGINGGPIVIDNNAGYDSFTISPDGVVLGIPSGDGDPVVLGQIQIATFPNPGGLSKAGGNIFVETPNSGAPNLGVPGMDGRGGLVSSALEMSNVDLSQEFAEMIVAQRAFQANTRMITTSDEILQELVNLKR
ncbi:flagellar basal body rod protein FlgG [Salipaludibacillus sp. LMS25]|jgi:flagellar hook protein FlgE|uniref:flagellar basal body rod protein FlgG n=1 Tax=Salipaludibacillus sp. LMS25 TaxID=2924031 RepID=UPI0020CFFBF0|nr:flagellar basal body rod protein FlgG [Salipaludibacillus sp. LMS25]UTR15093.1 flagellar basal body rod protein FlgG [Salipaludibacillus sp. LMS25]